MSLNWPMVILLIALSLPGIVIAVPRLINLLLQDNSVEMKRKISRFAMGQSVLMVVIMSITGSYLSKFTKIGAPILNPLLHQKNMLIAIPEVILPVFAMIIAGLILYILLERFIYNCFIDPHNQQVIQATRHAIKLDGSMLYSGVVDEIIARWGLLNLIAFFGFMLIGTQNRGIIWGAIILSSLFYAFGKVPLFISAGATPSRAFFYALIILQSVPSILFGFIFWKYGLLISIISHMLFNLGWWIFAKPTAKFS